MLSTIIWTLCFLGFVGFFGYQIWNRISVLLKLPAAPRLDRIPERIKAMLVYGIGQLKFFKGEQPAGVFEQAHPAMADRARAFAVEAIDQRRGIRRL